MMVKLLILAKGSEIMLVLMGKSASGKTTITQELVKKHGFHSIVTYTSRPMRKGETADVTYHYISKEDFLEKINSGFFAEWKSYEVNGDTWYYGTAIEDLINADEKSVVILTPDGVRDVKRYGIDCVVIYLYSDIDTIRRRLEARNDKSDKIEDRIKRDSRLFETAAMITNRVIQNLYTSDIDTIVDEILYHYNRILKQRGDSNF